MLTQKGRKEFQQRLKIDPQVYIQTMNQDERKLPKDNQPTFLALQINEETERINLKDSSNPENDAAFIEAVKWYVNERTKFLDSKGQLTQEESREKLSYLDDINDDIVNIEQSGKLKSHKQVEMAEFNISQNKKEDSAHYAKKAADIKNKITNFLKQPVNSTNANSALQDLQHVDNRIKVLLAKQNDGYLDMDNLQEYNDLTQSKRLIMEYLQPSSQKSIKQDMQHPNSVQNIQKGDNYNAQHSKSKSNFSVDNSLKKEADSVANKNFPPTANIDGIRRSYAEFYIRQKCVYSEPFDDQLLNEQVYNAPFNINAKGLDSNNAKIYNNLVRESLYYADQYAQKFAADMRSIRNDIESNIDPEEMSNLSEKQFSKKYVKEFEKRFNEKGYSKKFTKRDKEKIGRLANRFYKENYINEDDDVLDIIETPGNNEDEFGQKSRKQILQEHLDKDDAKIAEKGSSIAAAVSDFEQQVGKLEKLKKSHKSYRPLQEEAFANYAKLQQLYRQSATNPELLGNYDRDELGKDLQMIGKRFHEIGGTIEAKVNQLNNELAKLAQLKEQGKSSSKLEGKVFAHMAELQHLYRMHILEQQTSEPRQVLGNYDPALLKKNIIDMDASLKECSNNTKWAERNNHDRVDISDILLDGDQPQQMADKVMERMRNYAEKVKKDYEPWLSGKYSKSLTDAEKEDIREQRNREFNIGRKAIMRQLEDSNNMEAFKLVAKEFDEYKFKPSKKMGDKRGFRGLCRDRRISSKKDPKENDASREVSRYVKSIAQYQEAQSLSQIAAIMGDVSDPSIEDDLLILDEAYRNLENIAMADAHSMIQNDKIEPMASFMNEGNNKVECNADNHLLSDQGFYSQRPTQTSHGEEELDMKKVLKDGMSDKITGKGDKESIKDEFDKAQKEGDGITITKLGSSND